MSLAQLLAGTEAPRCQVEAKLHLAKSDIAGLSARQFMSSKGGSSIVLALNLGDLVCKTIMRQLLKC
jgi:hypothetical protein